MRSFEIYSAAGSPRCNEVTAFLDARRLPYVVRDLDNAFDRQETIRRAGRRAFSTPFPHVYAGEHLVGSFEELAGHSLNQLHQMIGE